MIASRCQRIGNRLNVGFHEQHGDNDNVTLGNCCSTAGQRLKICVPLCRGKACEVDAR